MKEILINFFKGLWTGGTMTVPGVSGGSMAMILGVYDRLVYSVSHIFKDFKKSFLFLLQFGLGGVLGFFLFAGFISRLLENPTLSIPLHFFFLGAVAGGIPIIFKSAKVKKFSAGCILYPIIGIICVVLISFLPEGLFSVNSSDGMVKFILLQLFGGFIVAFALVLPGISTSQMLNMLGIMDELYAVIDARDIMGLLKYIPLAVGGVVGTFVIAKILEPAIEKFPQATYLIIFGFLLGSLPELLTGVDFSAGTILSWILSVIAVAAGFAALYFMSRLEIKRIEEADKASQTAAEEAPKETKEK